MAANMDAMIRIAARVDGANAVQAFSRDLKGLDGAAKLSSKELGHMNIAINRMAREAGNTTSGIRAHVAALENLRSRVDIGSKAYGRLGNEIDQLRGKLRGLDGDAARGKSAFSGLGGALAGLGVAAAAIQASRFIIGKTSELETQTRSIQTLTGSLEQSKRIIGELQQLGAVTPFTSTELVESSKKLIAFGVDAEKVVETTRRLGDIAGATGANIGELSVVYGQVMAKGRLQGEELLQFQERGVGLQAELREMYGLTGEEFSKALEKGQISAEAVEIALQRLTDSGGKYANGAIAQSDTLAGRFSTLTDGVETLARTVGAALTPAIRGVLNEALFAINTINGLIATGARANGFGMSQQQRQQVLRQAEAEAEEIVNTRRIPDPFERNKQLQEVKRQRERDLIESYGYSTGQVKAPAKAPAAAALPPLGGGRAAGGGGGGGAGGGGARAAASAAEAAAKKAAAEREAAAAKIQSTSIELRNARELAEIEGRILEARLEDNQQLVIARTAQKELAAVRQQAADVLTNKEIPAAAKRNELDKLALQSEGIARQMAFDYAEQENKRAQSAQEALNRLFDERELLTARLNGNEAEVTLALQLRDITKGMADDERARTEDAFRNVQALKEQIKAADGMKALYSDIGMSIKDGVVGGIQGAIDGTKSLNEVASDLLSNIANKLLDVAINMALFGTMSGTGTGGGLLGGFFKAANGASFTQNGIQAFAKGGIVTSPTLFKFAQGGAMRNGLMGEAGEEAIMPLRRLPGGRLGVESTGGGTSAPITVMVNVDAKGTAVESNQTEGAQLGRAISAAMQAELVKQQRPGGLLAGTRR